MKQISSSHIREHFPELADRVRFKRDRVIVTRRGKELVAIVSIEDLETLEAAEDRKDLEDARKALRIAKQEKTIPWKEVKHRDRP